MKKVLVTGGTKGIGLAICRRLLFDGFSVVALSRSKKDQFQVLLEENPDTLWFEAFDLDHLDKIHSFVQGVCKEHGNFFGLVNNAGIGLDGALGTQHERDIERVLRINLHAPILLAKYFVRRMMAKREGRVVNVSSIVAQTGFSGLSVYAASKAGLLGFSRSLSREVGPLGITVNAIAPGFIETQMTAGLQKGQLETIIRRSPLGRLAMPDDVASGVSYLLGPGAKNITGTTLTVDGGSTA